MTDPQYDLRLWLQTELAKHPHGTKGALHQETEQPPEVMLPIAGMTFGSDANYEILRIHVNAFLYQDFSAQKGSDAAMLLRSMAEKLARESGRRPVPFGKGSGSGQKH